MLPRRPDSRQTPASAAAWNDLGNALSARPGRSEEALKCYERAIALTPLSADAFYNRGILLAALGRHRDALASYDRALELRPAFAQTHNNRAGVLAALWRHDEAVAACTLALELEPSFAAAIVNRATAQSLLGRHEAAAEDAARAIRLDAGLPYMRGMLLHSRLHCCDWQDYDASVTRIVSEVRSGGRVIEPFAFLGISTSPEDQLRCSQTWVRDHCPPIAGPGGIHPTRVDVPRIRVAYVSANFRDHPLGYLMAGLFERHDRSRFEVVAFSLGRSDGSAMRARLERAFERFIDASAYSDDQVVAQIQATQIDIVVDLDGFTSGARPGIFARRPAPLQVNYLGYPGTSGASHIDYVIADEHVVPGGERASYAEKVAYLPDSYFVNDAAREVAASAPSRAQAGLPEKGFVFCCFNNAYKVTPPMFDIWMRLLRHVDGSVLWLLEGNATACRNLRHEAEARGVAPDRLVFAPKLPNAQHLARHRLAQLFLDTLPYNAHTTASDALWMGVPLVTCSGTTFAGRVAASLLRAMGLPELITHSLAEYEALATRLASDAPVLESLAQRLAAHRDTCPLFDTDRTRRCIESAFAEMWARHQRGEPAGSFAVDREG